MYKLTMISKNLKGVRYISKAFHEDAHKVGGRLVFKTKEEAEQSGRIKVKVSKENHIANYVDFTVEPLNA